MTSIVAPTALGPSSDIPARALGPSPDISARALRPLLGGDVVVRTGSALWRGRLLSCVRDSAWFVVDDVDVVVPLGDLVSVRAA
jgi:hypothetical protein